MVAARDAACALVDGELYCWGDQDNPFFGADPAQRVGDERWDQVVLGGPSTCATRDGELYCWQRFFYVYVAVPKRLGEHRDWGQLSLAGNSLCGLRAGGELYCGRATRDFNDDSFLKRVGAESDWQQVSTSVTQGCGVRAGELHCWGAPATATESPPIAMDVQAEPQRLGDESDWQTVSVSDSYACGIRSGALYCWGYVPGWTRDELVLEPTRVDDESDWSEVHTGDHSACGLRRHGKLFCWGRNLAAGQEAANREPELDRPSPVAPGKADGPASPSAATTAAGCAAARSCVGARTPAISWASRRRKPTSS